MPAAPFDAFVLLAGMRTGSNFLQANLNAMPGLTCHGELFNPHFIGAQGVTEHLGIDLAARDRDPMALLNRVVATGPGLTGFRFFHDHDLRVLDRVLADPRVAKIVLTRNPLDSYVSWKIAQTTGQWKLTNPAALRRARAVFDAAEFFRWVQDQRTFHQHLRHQLQITGQTAFHISYDEVADVSVLNGLARFLGVEGALLAPDTTLKRQNPEPVRDKVTNPAEMEAALAALDPFAVGCPAQTEPCRTAAVPGYVVAEGAPLVFLPIPGGPSVSVEGWMAALGAGGIRSGMTQRDLRHWKRTHPGHRSFTVVRHPLLRAHQVFCTRVLGGALPDLRARLVRAQGLDLPPPGAAADLCPALRRAAFLGFLHLVKQGLGGQAGLRVDACWASQTAVLQGYATVRPPDMLFHENRLAEGLSWLAAETGLAAPPYRPQGEPTLPDVICDDEIERAAQDAYGRDYVEFGFSAWKPDAAA